jgi:hypothetical protein
VSLLLSPFRGPNKKLWVSLTFGKIPQGRRKPLNESYAEERSEPLRSKPLKVRERMNGAPQGKGEE